MYKCFIINVLLLLHFVAFAQSLPGVLLPSGHSYRVTPQESDEVLINPGIGFMTFQRFNGDSLNPGVWWTEGLPIVYQEFDGSLDNPNYPLTSIAYFRVDWAFVEPQSGQYNWAIIDSALQTAAERNQSLMLRIAPYEEKPQDVPPWYRVLIGKEKPLLIEKWQVDPENPLYLEHFGGLIKELGKRYDGHPNLLAVDISILGYWGEGEGSELIKDETRIGLLNAYLENFKKTLLLFQPLNGDAKDPANISLGTDILVSWPDGRKRGHRPVGFRFDCLGDLGSSMWPEQQWSHMLDIYPRDIIRSGMYESWKLGHVSAEVCWTFGYWKDSLNYNLETFQKIIDESLKWHISSLNAKSSAVPDLYKPLVDEWLKKMGYRFVMKRMEFKTEAYTGKKWSYTALWENKGVAPIYQDFKLAFRLRKGNQSHIMQSFTDIKTWLPGDFFLEDQVTIPHGLYPGTYDLDMAIINIKNQIPAVKLAILDGREDGWYNLGKLILQK